MTMEHVKVTPPARSYKHWRWQNIDELVRHTRDSRIGRVTSIGPEWVAVRFGDLIEVVRVGDIEPMTKREKDMLRLVRRSMREEEIE